MTMEVKLDSHTFFLRLIILTISFSVQSHSNEASTYLRCNHTYNCGAIKNIAYPFWGQDRPRYCGSSNQSELTCVDETTFMKVGQQRFRVVSINPEFYSMKLVQTDLSVACPWHFTNTSLDPSFLRYDNLSIQNSIIFYDCPPQVSSTNNITCNHDQRDEVAFYAKKDEPQKWQKLLTCKVHIQILVEGGLPEVKEMDGLNRSLSNGFVVQYIADWFHCSACNLSGGICGTGKGDASRFSCHCQNGIHAYSCPRRKNSIHLKLTLGFTGGAIGALLICITICYLRRKFWTKMNNDQDIEAILRNCGALGLRRYKFSDIKKMTNSFKVKLGQGGYGTVYKGELITGCSVAVKILDASKGNGEEFINEVAGISRTSHVNIVTLLGFCLERHKKVLVYEFMHNGSLEKFIYNKDHEATPLIGWKCLHQIALGIAQGLEYLHKGCNTRILHLDIKPHNILLDKNFCPKISDFGLAKLCLERESIVSMSNARGTIGFLAPEVWNRSFGGVSHKSDTYSYGMLLLEMVGGRKNTNTEVSCTSEIYFPYWVHKNLEMGSNLGLTGVMTAEESEIAKKMVLVGLWCIQTIPNDRPTISRVIEMLEGSINPLQMPPKPVLCSPPRSAMESSTE